MYYPPGAWIYPDERYYYAWYGVEEPEPPPPTDHDIKSTLVDRLNQNRHRCVLLMSPSITPPLRDAAASNTQLLRSSGSQLFFVAEKTLSPGPPRSAGMGSTTVSKEKRDPSDTLSRRSSRRRRARHRARLRGPNAGGAARARSRGRPACLAGQCLSGSGSRDDLGFRGRGQAQGVWTPSGRPASDRRSRRHSLLHPDARQVAFRSRTSANRGQARLGSAHRARQARRAAAGGTKAPGHQLLRVVFHRPLVGGGSRKFDTRRRAR